MDIKIDAILLTPTTNGRNSHDPVKLKVESSNDEDIKLTYYNYQLESDFSLVINKQELLKVLNIL